MTDHRPSSKSLDLDALAKRFRRKLKKEIRQLAHPITLVGLLSNDDIPSFKYADYTQFGCEDVGINFRRLRYPSHRILKAIGDANDDESVHGIIVYYSVLGGDRDAPLRESIDFRKDVEGLHSVWARKIYENDRSLDSTKTKKAILPCTALAVVKILDGIGVLNDALDEPLSNKVIAVFNRSDLVGRPLAAMLSNDGAFVYSCDIDGTKEVTKSQFSESSATRFEILKRADVVVTGVPPKTRFRRIDAAELKPAAVCVNFSSAANFSKSVRDAGHVFVPRIGPMTVAMTLRNTVRLFRNSQQ